MKYLTTSLGAMLLMAGCVYAQTPSGPMGCCSTDFDPKNPQASEFVPVRIIPQEDRLWNDLEHVKRRAAMCALLAEKGETRPWC